MWLGQLFQGWVHPNPLLHPQHLSLCLSVGPTWSASVKCIYFSFICCTNSHIWRGGSLRDSGLEPSKLPLSLILTWAQRGWEWGCPLLLFWAKRAGLRDFKEVWGIFKEVWGTLKEVLLSLVASVHACAPNWKLWLPQPRQGVMGRCGKCG